MYDKVKVTYLLNSGFILEIGDCAIIFDYYQDEKNIVDKIIQDKKEVYFFVSHVHYDHFNPKISAASKYASSNSFGHSGFTGTYTWVDPDNGILYVFLSNRVFPTMNNNKLADQNIRTEIHNLIYEAIIEK